MTDADLAAILAAAMTLPRPWTAAEFAELRRMPGLVEVLEADGIAIGRVAADEAELLTIAVLPAARRAGLGRALLSAFHDRARARGAATAFLEVADTNVAARALYVRAGYQEVGLRHGYYTEVHPPVDAVVMSRGL